MGQSQTPAWVWQSLKNIDQIEKLRRRLEAEPRTGRARMMMKA
ncbi:MAG: hypothetical protein ACREXU_15955 [Gammaproteobacteria bacterium]